MHQRAEATRVLFSLLEILQLHPQHMAQIKTVRAIQVSLDRCWAEPLHLFECLDAQRPSCLPRGRLIIRRQCIEQMPHAIGQLLVGAAKQQARRLQRVAVIALPANVKIHSPLAPAAHQQLNQPSVSGETIPVCAQAKRRTDAFRQKTIAVNRLRQKPFVGTGHEQMRRVLPRQFEPTLQIYRVRWTLWKKRFTAEIVEHK